MKNYIDVHNLENHFSNIVKVQNHNLHYVGEIARYTIGSNDFSFSQFEQEQITLYIFKDNFPFPKQSYSSDIPIRSNQNLVTFLQCAGIELCEKTLFA